MDLSRNQFARLRVGSKCLLVVEIGVAVRGDRPPPACRRLPALLAAECASRARPFPDPVSSPSPRAIETDTGAVPGTFLYFDSVLLICLKFGHKGASGLPLLGEIVKNTHCQIT